MIRFRTLGAVGLSRPEGPELRAVLAQPKRLALLTYLALARPRGAHRRDRLLAMFWPDSGDERARATLNRAIYFLRRELGDGVISSRGDEELAIDPAQFWCDAIEFEAQLDHGKLREALELFHGDLLPGFFTSDANGFEDWLEREREYLRDRASQAAASLAEAEESNGSLAFAVHWARRSVELSPFNEVGLRRLLGLLDAAGDRAGAEEAYQRFAAHMSSELEVAPAPETRALIERIRSRDRPASELPNVVEEHDTAPGLDARSTPRPAAASSLGARRRRWPIPAAVAATLIAVTTPAVLLARANWRNLDTHRVLVARFANLTGDSTFDMLGRVASDRIIQSLTTTGLVEVVDASALRVTPPALAASTLRAGAAEEAVRHRAGTVVTGEIHRDGSKLVVQAWVTDVAQDRIVWAIPGLAVQLDSVATAVEEVAERTTGAVAALTTERFAPWFPAATSPPRFSAFQEFAQGMELQLRGADGDAMPHLRRAVELDSTFTWGQLQLAQAYLNLYEEQRTDSIAAALNLHRERLTPLQRHWLDWMLSLRTEDPMAGYRAISKAAAIAPERFMLTLALCAEKLNRPREAATALERLSPESPYHGETEYWALLSRSYHALGERQRELAAARAARLRYPDRIEFIAYELSALAADGHVQAIRALLDTALAFPRPKVSAAGVIVDMPGHAHWPGRLMVSAATELRAHGFSKEADETLRRAIVWYRSQSPSATAVGTQRLELAKALYLAREWSAAEEIFQSLVAADTTDSFVYDGFLGTIAARKGDSITARRVLAKFDTLRASLVRPHAMAGYWQSKISALLGDEAGAMRSMTEAFGAQGRSGLHGHFDYESLWHSRRFREFVRPKG